MENNKLRQRFVKDYNLPINVFDEKLFNYYIELYDFFPREKWENLKSLIDEKYNGNVELWLDYCAKVRDEAINHVMGTQKYVNFNTCDLSLYKLTKNIGEHSYYTEATNGCRFISIDLKKANFQALKYVGVVEEKTYDELIEKVGGDDYIKGSKYLRQVIFGKMNPGRTVTIEKYIMEKIMKYADEVLPIGFELYSQNSDELVYKLNTNNFVGDIKIICPVLEKVVLNELNIEVRVEYVEVIKLPIVNCNDNNIDAFVRTNLNNGETVLKKASTTFYPQIYKLWKGLPIEDKDLIFYDNDQLAKFIEPLRFNN
jgi:hypothetical protein